MAILLNFIMISYLTTFVIGSEYDNCDPKTKTICFGLFPDDCVSHKNCIVFAYFKMETNHVKIHIERRQKNKTVYTGKSYGYYKRSDMISGIADAGDVWAAVAFSTTNGMDNSISFDCLKSDQIKAEYSFNVKRYRNVKLKQHFNWKRSAINYEKSFSCDWIVPMSDKLQDQEFKWDLNTNSYYFLMAFGELSSDKSENSILGANNKMKHDERKNFGSFYLSKPDVSMLYKSALRVQNSAEVTPEIRSTSYFTYSIICIGLILCVVIIAAVVYAAKRKQFTLLDPSKDGQPEALPETKNFILL